MEDTRHVQQLNHLNMTHSYSSLPFLSLLLLLLLCVIGVAAQSDAAIEQPVELTPTLPTEEPITGLNDEAVAVIPADDPPFPCSFTDPSGNHYDFSSLTTASGTDVAGTQSDKYNVNVCGLALGQSETHINMTGTDSMYACHECVLHCCDGCIACLICYYAICSVFFCLSPLRPFLQVMVLEVPASRDQLQCASSIHGQLHNEGSHNGLRNEWMANEQSDSLIDA